MSADAPRKDERNARRVITAGAGIVFAVAGSAFVGWLGGPSILLRPSPADAEVSPASAIGFAICAAGLVAWAGERFRAAAWCGAAVSLLGAVAAATAAFPASPAGAETGGPGALLRGVPPFAACAFVVAGLVSFFGAREVVGHAEARRGSRIVAGGAALAVHSVGAAALLQRIFTGPSDPPILVAPYAAVGFAAFGAGIGAVVWREEIRAPLPEPLERPSAVGDARLEEVSHRADRVHPLPVPAERLLPEQRQAEGSRSSIVSGRTRSSPSSRLRDQRARPRGDREAGARRRRARRVLEAVRPRGAAPPDRGGAALGRTGRGA
jgi:hypothetical protein